MSCDAESYTAVNFHSGNRAFDYRAWKQDGKLSTWQREFRERLQETLGLSSILETYRELPLSACNLEVVKFATYRREKWTICSEPGVKIPFYLFLPNSTRPVPLLMILHGHNKTGKEVFVSTLNEQPEVAVVERALSEGYAVMTPDVRGFGEMARQQDLDAGRVNSCEALQRQSLLFGRTLIGERVYDVHRLIDYALTRPEIDSSRIVVNGHSGGGAVTLLAAACDLRISHAIPTSYFCTFEASILAMDHCICNVIPNIMKLGEMYDIAGLIAPRPLFLIHGSEDRIFPVSATRESFSHVQAIYRELEDGFCELYVGKFGHRIEHKPMWDFLRKHLE